MQATLNMEWNLDHVLTELRTLGSDTVDIEVKAAHAGFPSGMGTIICAFANRPGGGTIICGVDERSNFAPVGVYDAAHCQRSLTTTARTACDPPVTVTTTTQEVEGVPLVFARVHEMDAAHKPVRLKSTGVAYLRHYDSTYPLADMEVQAFIAGRSQPRYDCQPVEGADPQRDLDPGLVADFIRSRKRRSARLTRYSDEEILTRSGVLTPEGGLSLAGLLVLGEYPQQFYPNLMVHARIPPPRGEGPEIRALDSRVFDGPLPAIIDAATLWVAQHSATAVTVGEGGAWDVPDFPTVAVREIIANAVVHRDLGPHALGEAITLILQPDRLTLTNPGGLFGLTVDTLGLTASHPRNHRVADLAAYTHTSDGERIIERFGTGIPAVRYSMQQAGLPLPTFVDTGLRFTVILRSQRSWAKAAGKISSPRHDSSVSNVGHIVNALRQAGREGLTRSDLVTATGLRPRQVMYLINTLRREEVVEKVGTNRSTRYRLKPTETGSGTSLVAK